jgi:WD40 repeat protein
VRLTAIVGGGEAVYDGFLSYSHAADGRLAPALQRGLQRLAKRWNQRRALRIFRDETGLATNPHLWSAIEAALDESEWFVLLASPEAARSEWVNKEIEHWLATKSVDHLLPVVTDGAWEWDPRVGDFAAGSSAVPEALRGGLVAEPRHLDVRWARSETDLDLRNSRFRSAVADLAAPMHGVAKDELESEDIRQHRRVRRLARAAVTVVVLLLVVSIVFGLLAVVQRNRANDEARAAELRGLVSDSRAAVAQDPQLAGLLANEAYRRSSDANTRDALLGSVLAEPRLQRSFGPGTGVLYAGALTGDRVAVATSANGASGPYALSVWNWETGREQSWRAAPRPGRGCSGPVGLATSANGQQVAVVTADGLLHLFSGRTLQPQGGTFPTGLDPAPACNAPIAFSPNGSWLAAASGSYVGVRARFTGTSAVLFERVGDGWQPGPTLSGHDTRVNALAFSQDSKTIATGSPPGTDPSSDPGLIVLHEVQSGVTGPVIQTRAGLLSLALDGNRHRVVAGTTIQDTLVYDLDAPSAPIVISGLGSATAVAYDADRTVLGILGTRGFRVLDAASLEPTNGPDLEPKSGSGPVLFLPNGQILLTGSLGPMTRWDLRSTSVLQTVIANSGSVRPTTRPGLFIAGTSASDGTFITMLGANYQPLTAQLPVGAQQSYGPAWCADPHTNRIATVGTGTPAHRGEIVVRRGSAPFDVVTRTAGVDFVPLGCAWRPDGRQIAIGGLGGEVALYQVATGTARRVDAGLSAFALSLAYRPHASELWVTGPTNSSVRITNLDRTPRIAAALPHLGVISALQFTPDGRYLVTVDTTNVQILDAHSLKPLTQHTPVGTDFVYLVAVSPEGRAALTADTGPWMRLIDRATGHTIGPRMHSNSSGSVSFGHDNTTIYASTPDGRPTVWHIAPTQARDAACQLAGRNLTKTEWQRYLPWAGPRRATCPQYPLS